MWSFLSFYDDNNSNNVEILGENKNMSMVFVSSFGFCSWELHPSLQLCTEKLLSDCRYVNHKWRFLMKKQLFQIPAAHQLKSSYHCAKTDVERPRPCTQNMMKRYVAPKSFNANVSYKYVANIIIHAEEDSKANDISKHFRYLVSVMKTLQEPTISVFNTQIIFKGVCICRLSTNNRVLQKKDTNFNLNFESVLIKNQGRAKAHLPAFALHSAKHLLKTGQELLSSDQKNKNFLLQTSSIGNTVYMLSLQYGIIWTPDLLFQHCIMRLTVPCSRVHNGRSRKGQSAVSI